MFREFSSICEHKIPNKYNTRDRLIEKKKHCLRCREFRYKEDNKRRRMKRWARNQKKKIEDDMQKKFNKLHRIYQGGYLHGLDEIGLQPMRKPKTDFKYEDNREECLLSFDF